MRVLISGFEAFGGKEHNPSAQIVEALDKKLISYPAELTVNQILLPVTFEHSFRVLNEKIQSFNPDVIIALGMADRKSIDLESVAINYMDARIPDNQGDQPRSRMINPHGPPSYLSSLPLQGIESCLKAAAIPVSISSDAGAFVCNYLFYRLMETNQETFRLCGFIHVPEKDLSPEILFRSVSLILHYINY